MVGQDVPDILSVIDQIYEAALRPALWPDALAMIGRYSDAWGVQLHLWDRAGRTVPFSATAGGVSASSEALYIAHYGALDPRVARLDSMAPGEMLVCTEHFDDRYVSRSEFYQDFLLPSGGRYVAGGKLCDDGTRAAIIGIHRGADRGPFDTAGLTRIRLLLPHLRRAIQIHQGLEATATEAGLLRAALDRLSLGVLLVDAQASIILLNAYAEAMLRRADGLFSARGRLAARAPDDHQALLAAIHRSGGSLAVRRAETSQPLLLVAAPLSAGSASRFAYRRSAVLLLVRDPADRAAPPETALQVLFQLTKREAAVASLLAAGHSLDEAAARLAIARETARVHLRRVFDKTETRRQGELIAVLQRSLAPLAN
jgi:DNA-binding CsgD family transcriptional regulator